MANRKVSKQRYLWFEQIMAIIATINLGLVFFDLSYVPWRNFYYRNLRQITQLYDGIKGIEPHRETEKYLQVVAGLEQQVSKTGLQSPEVAKQLEEIRRLSDEMIETNPFAGANKSGTLERIKNRFRQQTNEESAKKAFRTFWSQEYLSKKGWNQEINFFNKEIQPLIAVNYFRHIGEDGDFIDLFWIIDLPFIVFFGVELAARGFLIKRSHNGFSWLDAILWRPYDLLLLLPFWRVLRVIPVLVRLDQAQLINLNHIRQQIHRGIIGNFAEELTEIVVVRVINKIQVSLKQGELIRWFTQKENLRPYIHVNNVNEVEAISAIFVKTIIYQVLPKVQPEIISLLQHNIESALKQSPLYSNLQLLPGVGQMQNQLSNQIATQVATNLYSAIVSAVEDPVSAELSSELVQSFSDALGGAMQKQHVTSELQELLSDLLEEVKLNYVQSFSQEDMEQILEQTRQLRKEATIQTVNSSVNILPSQKK
jgi:hypothetical protein